MTEVQVSCLTFFHKPHSWRYRRNEQVICSGFESNTPGWRFEEQMISPFGIVTIVAGAALQLECTERDVPISSRIAVRRTVFSETTQSLT